MGAERRRHLRARCRIPCDIVLDGATMTGEVRNISAGGLGVLAEAPSLEQGEPVTIVLRAPGTRPFEISALVWHVRQVKRGADGKVIRSWGLVLGDASPAFAELVEKLSGSKRRAAVPAPPPRAEPQHRPVSEQAAPSAPPAAPPLLQFAIRIRQIGGPRTCRVIACGASEGEAVSAALAEVGTGWSLLDVRPLP